jgi:predicted phosphohydrolase
MKIQYCSDLHLEFPDNDKYLKENPIEPVGDILLLAGDIIPFAIKSQYEYFFDFVSANFQTTYWVPGNHEYYRGDVAEMSGSFKESIRSNVYLVNNHAEQHGHIKFIFSTLWANIGEQNKALIQQFMHDYRVVRFKGGPYTTEHTNQLHLHCMDFIKEALPVSAGISTFVVSHHIPTHQHYPPQYEGSPLNDGFATRLDNFIAEAGPDYWLYGHHHYNAPEFKIGRTTLLTNQLGYVKLGEHEGYRSEAVVEV